MTVLAITLAYHKIQDDHGIKVLEHYDWSDELSVECRDCGWGEGPDDTCLSNQLSLKPLGEIFSLDED